MQTKLHKKQKQMIATRIFLIALFAIAFIIIGWLFANFGLTIILIFIASLIIAIAIAWLNTSDAFFVPNPKYKLSRDLYWEEAAPVEPSFQHERLLFCVHGYPATPADYRKLVPLSNSCGWDLAAPLLPGCGTSPEDFLRTEWSQYLACVKDEWLSLRPKYKQAFLIGTSMGGSLCLALAEEYCGDEKLAPTAIATIGAPAVLNAFLRYGMMENPFIYLARFLAFFIPSINARHSNPLPDNEDGGGNWLGYEGIFTKQTYTLQIGLKNTERNLHKVTCPAIIIHARGDKIVPYKNAFIIM